MSSPATIGAVIAELERDFPGLTISKIRFLEAAGLVRPARTDAGYRVFTRADVDRLRYVLTAQREWFWPLKVIREALDALDRGLTPPSPTAGARPGVPAAPVDPQVPMAHDLAVRRVLRLTDEEVARSAKIDLDLVGELCTYGLIAPDAGGHFGEDDLAVARAAGELAAYGIQPRHLRLFRTAADREVGLVDQVLSTRRAAVHGRAQPDPAAQILASCIGLHVALVRAGLRRAGRT